MQAIKGQRPPKVPPIFFFSRSQVHNLCSGVPPTDKVRKKNATDSGAQDLKSSAEKKKQQISGRLMPHNRPQRKKGPQSP